MIQYHNQWAREDATKSNILVPHKLMPQMRCTKQAMTTDFKNTTTYPARAMRRSTVARGLPCTCSTVPVQSAACPTRLLHLIMQNRCSAVVTNPHPYRYTHSPASPKRQQHAPPAAAFQISENIGVCEKCSTKLSLCSLKGAACVAANIRGYTGGHSGFPLLAHEPAAGCL